MKATLLSGSEHGDSGGVGRGRQLLHDLFQLTVGAGRIDNGG